MTDPQPAAGEPRYEILGPITQHRVIVNGRQVPFLNAAPANGGKIWLSLDDRYGLEIDVADADRLIPWIADAIAIGMGYTCHPPADREPLRSTPFPRMIGITSLVTEEAQPDD